MYNHHLSSTTFLLNTCKGTEVVDSTQLVRIEAISNYSKLFFRDGRTLVVAKVLAYFEEQLHTHGFTRLHRSHIINMKYIQHYQQERNGVVTLTNTHKIAVSKRKKTAFRRIMQFYFEGLRQSD
jgi:two-component system LytT family response regulator